MLKENEITSLKNSQIKRLKKLTQKKYRRQNNAFIVENLAMIYDALNSGFDFLELFVTKEFIDKNTSKFDHLQSNTKIKEYYLIDPDLNRSYSQLDTPSGITAVYSKNNKAYDDNGAVVYLNGIKDPGNIGTIMRSALAFDVANIVVDSECVDIYNYKSVSAARDSIFKLSILEDENGKWLNGIKGKLPIYVASSNSGEKLLDIHNVNNFCLVLGSESHGVSQHIIGLADKSIKIEISKQIESLNVASAAAILLYKLRS